MKEKKHMVKTSSFSVAYILLLGQIEIPELCKKDVEELVAQLSGIDHYWDIPDTAKWVPLIRTKMELVIRNIFLDFPKYTDPSEFLDQYPDTISINVVQKGITHEEISHLVRNGWITHIGLIE